MTRQETGRRDSTEAEILWMPSPSRIAASRMTRFQTYIEQRTDRHFPGYRALHAWSIEFPEAFWESMLDFNSVRWSGDPSPVVTSRAMPGARWFPNLRLDFARNLLDRQFSGPAILAVSETSDRPREISAAELREQVAAVARGLHRLGIQEGDRVAGYLANIPEAIIACLGSASVGAVWSSASPDFGLRALVDRLSEVEPRVVFGSSEYRYGGKTYSTESVLRELKHKVPSIEAVVTVGPDSGGVGDLSWEGFLESSKGDAFQTIERPFNHPLYVLFSSGTTGKPKCMVHGAGGTLVQHLKELRLHSNLGRGSRLLFFTTCGWMMWNWQLTALATGATVCLYDGHPGFPSLDRLWTIARDLGVTHLGTSGRYLEACMKQRFRIDPTIETLESVLYTGSPLSPDGFRWVYDAVSDDLHLAGISGGTDIVSCFVLGNPNLPVRAGEIQCKGLGVDVVALGEAGREITDRPGELVCRQPLPSMPLEFLNDPDGSRYRAAYFEQYPGYWMHGDFVEFRSASGGVVIYGRSDATLNPGGVRIGAAEIYNTLTGIPELTGALVSGWTPPGRSDEIIILSVTIRDPGPAPAEAAPELANRIRTALRENCSPRHVPRAVFVVSGIPVTRSGKVVELSVKAVLAGRDVSNRDALANPEILDEFQKIRLCLLERWGMKSDGRGASNRS